MTTTSSITFNNTGDKHYPTLTVNTGETLPLGTKAVCIAEHKEKFTLNFSNEKQELLCLYKVKAVKDQAELWQVKVYSKDMSRTIILDDSKSNNKLSVLAGKYFFAKRMNDVLLATFVTFVVSAMLSFIMVFESRTARGFFATMNLFSCCTAFISALTGVHFGLQSVKFKLPVLDKLIGTGAFAAAQNHKTGFAEIPAHVASVLKPQEPVFPKRTSSSEVSALSTG